MKHIPVTSSAIKSIGYDKATNEMVVTFHTGSTVTHIATQQQYDAFMQADSKGLHYAKHFKSTSIKPVKKAVQNFKMK